MSTFVEFTSAPAFSPEAVVAAGVEAGARGILLDRAALPAAFFDLRTRTAGELAQRLMLYGVRLACVVPDLEAHPERFKEFAREANRGEHVRFFDTRDAAVAWLESA